MKATHSTKAKIGRVFRNVFSMHTDKLMIQKCIHQNLAFQALQDHSTVDEA